jgi:hypothetical protein
MKYNKYLNNKILFGGDNLDINLYKDLTSTKQMEVFLSIIIIGYFGIKIIYGYFFNFYPEKYYYRNINVTTNEKIEGRNTGDITLNAYVPGIWNNEITDFITLIVLSAVIFIYTHVSTKSFVDINGNLSLSFLFGYIIGLGYPPIYTNYIQFYQNASNSSVMIKYIYLVVLLAFIMFVIILNYNEANKLSSVHKINYLVYACAIVLLFFGLIIAKKNIKSYNSATYFYNNGEQCTFAKNGVFQSSGDILNITLPFLVFIILLFFSYEPQELSMKGLYTFIYGLLLGILVSSISYYGIEYFLMKQPEKECKDLNECILKEMPPPLKETQQEINNKNIIKPNNINANIKGSLNINIKNKGKVTISLLKVISIIIIIIICIFLIFFYFKK